VTDALELVVYGEPQPAGSKRHIGGGRVVDANPAAKEWKRVVAQAAGQAFDGRQLWRGPLEMTVRFYVQRPAGHFGTGRNAGTLRPSAPPYPTTRPDTTKLIRGVEDALTGIVWADDAQIIRQGAIKLYGTPTRCEIQVRPL
jgi:Holliday junction resolvase RusA-like endonuclease